MLFYLYLSQHSQLTLLQLGGYASPEVIQEVSELYHWMGDFNRLAGNHCLLGLPGWDYLAEHHLDVGH